MYSIVVYVVISRSASANTVITQLVVRAEQSVALGRDMKQTC